MLLAGKVCLSLKSKIDSVQAKKCTIPEFPQQQKMNIDGVTFFLHKELHCTVLGISGLANLGVVHGHVFCNATRVLSI